MYFFIKLQDIVQVGWHGEITQTVNNAKEYRKKKAFLLFAKLYISMYICWESTLRKIGKYYWKKYFPNFKFSEDK